MSDGQEPPLHVLLLSAADDARQTIEILEHSFPACTWEQVATLEAACCCLQTERYSAVLADYQLPGLDWTALLVQLSQPTPLICVVSAAAEGALLADFPAGVTDYVLKDRLFRLPTVLRRSLQQFELSAARAQMAQQAQHNALISRIVQKVRESLVLDEILQTMVDLLHEALAVDRCVVLLLEPDDQLLIRAVSQQADRREQLLGFRLSCPVYKVYREQLHEGQVIVLSQLQEGVPDCLKQLPQKLFIQAILMVPLIYQNRCLGAISLQQCDRSRQWEEDDVNLVKAIADQCAIAIHQAQLFIQVQQQAQREHLLNQISRNLNSSFDPAYILQEIVRLAGECLRVDRVILFRVDPHYFSVQHEWRTSEAILSTLHCRFPAYRFADFLKPCSDYQKYRIFYLPDYQQHARQQAVPEVLQEPSFMQIRSLLCTPIFVRDQLYGGLGLHAIARPRVFTADDMALLQRLGDATAIALQSATRHEQLTQLVQQRTLELEQEKQLSEAANRAKSEFLTHMSHELRTPLTGILGFADVLQRQMHGRLSEKQLQYVDGISSCGQHLLDLINDLLDLSKIEAGREDLFLETVLVQEVCDACIDMVREAAQARQLQLELEVAPEVSICTADKRRLKQILSNLLSNAVKFTDQGWVRLAVRQQQQQLCFAVSDTGIGIAPADQQRLFQSFQQLQGGLDRKYEGTGLGLVLASKLAALHGGTITVESTYGVGSCFTLVLPAS